MYRSFHETIHHDSSINKEIINIIIEFADNFLYSSGFFYLVILYLLGIPTSNIEIFIWYGLVYSIYHNINQEIEKPIEHRKHHEQSHGNYGFDYLDIFYKTKLNDNCEMMNSGVITNFVSLFIVLFLKQIYNKSAKKIY